jgi:hypothetical protein
MIEWLRNLPDELLGKIRTHVAGKVGMSFGNILIDP